MITSHLGCDRVRFSTHIPPIQTTTIASDAGLSRPAIFTDAGSKAPISTTDTVSTTSKPSRTGTSDPTRYVSGLAAKRSHTTSTIVAVAMPPIRFPAASPRWPDSAAEMVTANSGRLPGDGKQHHPAERVAYSQPCVNLVCGLRKLDTGNPGCTRRGNEHEEYQEYGKGPHTRIIADSVRRGHTSSIRPAPTCVLLAGSFAIAGLGLSQLCWIAVLGRSLSD